MIYRSNIHWENKTYNQANRSINTLPLDKEGPEKNIKTELLRESSKY